MSSDITYLEGVVVEELDSLVGEVPGTPLRVQDLADVLKLPEDQDQE